MGSKVTAFFEDFLEKGSLFTNKKALQSNYIPDEISHRDEQIDAIYEIVGSPDADAQLRSAAAGAYGALNLPSQKVKDLILDQAKS